jgi:TPR repeat protein
MSSVRGQETGRRRRIADVIGAQIEPVTRFKATDLKELAPDQDSSAELVVTTRQRVDLDIECVTHAGRLPDGIAKRPDAAALAAELQQRLAAAESGATTRIQQWAAEEPGRYRRLLPSGGLFSDSLNETIGTDWPCSACAQHGRRACNGCTGSGTQTCPDCQGLRHATCLQCRGLGRLACGACEGRGEVRPPPPPGPTDTPAAPGTLVPCAACSQGWLNCSTCAGLGEQDCARCAASGRIVCPDCEGRQELDCPDCAATGWLHQWGQLRQRLEVEDLLEMHHPDPAITDAITARLRDVTTLDETCTLEQVRYTTAPLAVQAVQRLKLPVRQAQLQVAGQPMRFTALGPALEIVDHQHIAAVLLAHDLATLEKNAAGSGRHLGEALQRFLQSPLNRDIASRMPPADIASLHPRMVDEAYQARALQAAQRAIERLWLQRAWRPRLFCLVGIGVVAALAVVLGSPRLGVWTGAALAVVLGMAAWVVADWQVRHRLARSLQIPHGDRLLRPLRRSATVRRWQATSLAAATVVALASAGAMTQLPPVRQHTEQARAAAALAQQLDAWLVSEGKDYRLRHYPAAAALAQAAEQTPADPRARLVRAWQLLLGTDGVTPDPRAAEHLLDGLDSDPRLGSAAVVAQARATLWLRSRSAPALQAAATALAALPDPQQPEALFTLALVQLTPPFAARAGGLQEGLATLQQAADLGHASACFELGRRLASGTGLRRDLVGARRYLGYAEAKGVPGAAQAAAALR